MQDHEYNQSECKKVAWGEKDYWTPGTCPYCPSGAGIMHLFEPKNLLSLLTYCMISRLKRSCFFPTAAQICFASQLGPGIGPSLAKEAFLISWLKLWVIYSSLPFKFSSVLSHSHNSLIIISWGRNWYCHFLPLLSKNRASKPEWILVSSFVFLLMAPLILQISHSDLSQLKQSL